MIEGILSSKHPVWFSEKDLSKVFIDLFEEIENLQSLDLVLTIDDDGDQRILLKSLNGVDFFIPLNSYSVLFLELDTDEDTDFKQCSVAMKVKLPHIVRLIKVLGKIEDECLISLVKSKGFILTRSHFEIK